MRRNHHALAYWGLLGVVLLACNSAPETSGGRVSVAPPVVHPNIGRDAAASVSRPVGVPSLAPLVRKADPAVVFVQTQQAMPTASGRNVSVTWGSGFIFDPDGYVLTNHHVLSGAKHVQILWGDSRKLRGEVVGEDSLTDIAVVRLEEKNLPHLPLGESSTLEVGDWVVAIGNPFGLSHTVSAGIISAKGRTRNDVQGLDTAGYYSFLQTDASINRGNSGGPLIDLMGRVVGVNTAVKPHANNIGFAIPIDMVREILPALIENGAVERSAMGVHVASLRHDDVARLGLKSRRGVLVTRVRSGGPGARVGLLPDDVIVAFDGKPATSSEQLRWRVSISSQKAPVLVQVLRRTRALTLRVQLEPLRAPRAAQHSEVLPSE